MALYIATFRPFFLSFFLFFLFLASFSSSNLIQQEQDIGRRNTKLTHALKARERQRPSKTCPTGCQAKHMGHRMVGENGNKIVSKICVKNLGQISVIFLQKSAKRQSDNSVTDRYCERLSPQ